MDDRHKPVKQSDWSTKTSELPVRDRDESVSPETAASKAVANAFDKHKSQLEQELKKLEK